MRYKYESGDWCVPVLLAMWVVFALAMPGCALDTPPNPEASQGAAGQVSVSAESLVLACNHFKAAKAAMIQRAAPGIGSGCVTYAGSTTTYCGPRNQVIITFPTPVQSDRTWARAEVNNNAFGSIVCKCSGGLYAPARCTQLMSFDPSGWPNPLVFF